MAAGLIIALSATLVSVVASLVGLLSKKKGTTKTKVILETGGKREEYELTSEQMDELLHDIQNKQQMKDRVVTAH